MARFLLSREEGGGGKRKEDGVSFLRNESVSKLRNLVPQRGKKKINK